MAKAKGRALLATAEPDPFEAKERDRILECYRENNRSWFAFLYFQFWVGTRPSEAIALREADVDLESGMVGVSKSRDEGEFVSIRTSSKALRQYRPSLCTHGPTTISSRRRTEAPFTRVTGRRPMASTMSCAG
jgi:integrase